MLSRIFLLVFLTPTIYGFCPKLFNNQTACSCETTVEGPVIKCSGTDGLLIVDKLKLSHMEIKEFTLESANIIEIGPRAFKNLRIKKLTLDKNRIQRIHEHAFQGLENVLQELSISENSLQQVPTKSLTGMKVLSILSLRCNKIGNITKPLFVNMTSLIDVNLACNKICDMADDTFTNVHSTLQNLILDSNCLTKVPSLAFKNMNNLIALHMKYNKIGSLNQNDLTNLTSLSMVTLNGNEIEKINGGVLNSTPNLRYLYLNENNISTFDNGVMGQFKEAQVIDLSYNNISTITNKMFEGLESVQHLNLDSNQIQFIEPGAFSGTPLLLLWLPNNCLTEITQQTFQGALFLRMVSLSNNNIKSIQEMSFGHLANLHTLDLANNKIVSLQNKSLSGAENLAVRLQENPMVCSENGFHVLNAGEAINLTNEMNNVCKENWKEEKTDKCPKSTRKQIIPTCCSTNVDVTSSAVTHMITSTMRPDITTTEPMSLKKTEEKEETLDKNIDETGNEKNEKISSAEDLSQASSTAVKKINMERFWRLSQKPSGKSPYMRHSLNNKPKFLQTTTELTIEKGEDSSDYDEDNESDHEATSADDSSNDDEAEYIEEKSMEEKIDDKLGESGVPKKNTSKIPARIRERQKMFASALPWMSQSRNTMETTEESFSNDDTVETIIKDNNEN